MLRDELLTLCESFDTTGKTAEEKVTNVLDFGEVVSTPGINKRGAGYLNVQVTETISGGTNSVLKIQDSVDNVSFATVSGSSTIVLSGLKEGDVVSTPLPKVRRFVTVAYSAGSGTDSGSFTAWVGDKATQH